MFQAVCSVQTPMSARHRRMGRNLDVIGARGDEARGDMEGGTGRLKGDKRMEPEKDEVGAE